MDRGGKPIHWSAYVAFSLRLWISSEDGTRDRAEVRDNASSEPIFVYIRSDKTLHFACRIKLEGLGTDLTELYTAEKAVFTISWKPPVVSS